MAQYTTLTKNDIDGIAVNFSVSKINSFNILSGGSENTNYLLNAEKEKYVLTICEQKTTQKATELALLLEHLEANNFESSKIVRNNNNESIGFWNDKPFMLKKFLDGTVYESMPTHLLELVGIQLGKLHKIEAPSYLAKQANFGKEQFVNIKKYAANSKFETWLNQKMETITPYFELDLPKTLIHSDLFSNNVVISKDETAASIMDFEEAVYYYRIFDIGMTIIGACRNENAIDFNKVETLLKGYSKEISLTDLEINALQIFTVYAGTAMTFWRHLNFNYTEPTPDLFNHYLGLKVITDSLEKQPSNCFSNFF